MGSPWPQPCDEYLQPEMFISTDNLKVGVGGMMKNLIAVVTVYHNITKTDGILHLKHDSTLFTLIAMS